VTTGGEQVSSMSSPRARIARRRSKNEKFRHRRCVGILVFYIITLGSHKPSRFRPLAKKTFRKPG
jgi:hypothetical protein